MANKRYSQNISTLKQSATGTGVKPLSKGKPTGSYSIKESTASWPGLPGKAQKDRSWGVHEEKVYATAKGIRGGVDDDPGESKDPSRGGEF